MTYNERLTVQDLQRKDAQVFQKDFDTHADEDDAACNLRLGLVTKTKDVPDLHADGGEQEGGNPDEGDCGYDVHFQKSEGDANGQGVNAGGQGKQEHGLERQGVVRFFLLFGQGLPEHGDANEGEQYESDPVIDGGNIGFEALAQEKADQWHEALKTAKPQSDNTRFLQIHFFQSQSLADGDGKCIHGESDGDQKQFYNTHVSAAPKIVFQMHKNYTSIK